MESFKGVVVHWEFRYDELENKVIVKGEQIVKSIYEIEAHLSLQLSLTQGSQSQNKSSIGSRKIQEDSVKQLVMPNLQLPSSHGPTNEEQQEEDAHNNHEFD